MADTPILSRADIKKRRRLARRDHWENMFDQQLRALELPEPQKEVRLFSSRKWRYDRVWAEFGIIVEIEGITKQGGRHQRLPGFLSDCEKYLAAQTKGWRVIRIPGQMVKDGRGVQALSYIIEKVQAGNC